MADKKECSNAVTLRMIAEALGRDGDMLVSLAVHVQELAKLALKYVPFTALPLGFRLRWLVENCNGGGTCVRCKHQYGACLSSAGEFIPRSQTGGCFEENIETGGQAR
jgi:hypothetical protein